MQSQARRLSTLNSELCPGYIKYKYFACGGNCLLAPESVVLCFSVCGYLCPGHIPWAKSAAVKDTIYIHTCWGYGFLFLSQVKWSFFLSGLGFSFRNPESSSCCGAKIVCLLREIQNHVQYLYLELKNQKYSFKYSLLYKLYEIQQYIECSCSLFKYWLKSSIRCGEHGEFVVRTEFNSDSCLFTSTGCCHLKQNK